MLSSNVAGIFIQFDYSDVQSSYVMEGSGAGGGNISAGAIAQAVQTILIDDFANLPSAQAIAQAVELVLVDNFSSVPSAIAIAAAVRTVLAPELGQITEQRTLEGLNPQAPLVINRWTQGGVTYTTRVAGNITQTITQTTQGETTTITVQRTT